MLRPIPNFPSFLISFDHCIVSVLRPQRRIKSPVRTSALIVGNQTTRILTKVRISSLPIAIVLKNSCFFTCSVEGLHRPIEHCRSSSGPRVIARPRRLINIGVGFAETTITNDAVGVTACTVTPVGGVLLVPRAVYSKSLRKLLHIQ